MCVGCDASSTSLGWSLLPSSTLIVLALVNSDIPHQGDLGIPTRPGSATSLPDSTASTGLLCLLVGAHVHRGRSDIKVDHVATTVCILHICHALKMMHAWQWPHAAIPSVTPNMMHLGTN